MIICRVCLGYKKHVEASLLLLPFESSLVALALRSGVLFTLASLDLLISVISCDISKTLPDHL